MRTVPVAMVALVLAGCGSGMADRQQFIARADTQCQKAHPKVASFNSRLSALRTSPIANSEKYAQLASILGEAIPILHDELTKLEALKPPAGDATVWQRFLGAAEAYLTTLGDVRSAAEHQDVVAYIRAANTVNRHRGELEGIARGYGLMVCGTGLTSR
jgi:hypothetical protein